MQEMSYCNRCGANLKPLVSQANPPPTRIVGAAWAVSLAVALITLGGFALIFTGVMVMVTRGIRLTDEAMALIFAALLVIVMIDWLLIRQLSRVIGKAKEQSETNEKVVEQRKLVEKPVARIGPPREPLQSVTENTTRTFDPVYRERDTQR